MSLKLLCALTLLPVVAPCPAAADFTVYAFSQSDVDQEDPQVYRLAPDGRIFGAEAYANGIFPPST